MKSPLATKSNAFALAAAALAAAAIGYFVFGSAGDKAPMRADASNAELVERGAEIYAAQCATCHGANLEGQPNWRQRKANGRLPAPPHDATGHTWHHDDRTLFELTKYGLAELTGQPVATDMPAYDGVLPDDDIWAVLASIKSHWPETVRVRQTEITSRAQRSRQDR